MIPFALGDVIAEHTAAPIDAAHADATVHHFRRIEVPAIIECDVVRRDDVAALRADRLELPGAVRSSALIWLPVDLGYAKHDRPRRSADRWHRTSALGGVRLL